MTREFVRCGLCGWEHSEDDVESVIPKGLFQSFSDPKALSGILHSQRRDRLAEAHRKHMKEKHPQFRLHPQSPI